MVMGLVNVSADCVTATSTGLTPSALKRTIPVRFSVSFVSKEMRTARSPLPLLRSTLSHLLRGSAVHSAFDEIKTSNEPELLPTIFSLKLTRRYDFPVLLLPESSLLQLLQHNIIVPTIIKMLKKESLCFIYAFVLVIGLFRSGL